MLTNSQYSWDQDIHYKTNLNVFEKSFYFKAYLFLNPVEIKLPWYRNLKSEWFETCIEIHFGLLKHVKYHQLAENPIILVEGTWT